VVISNDSDLRLPVQQARRLVPVGIVSPHRAASPVICKGR
jgi:hypothetical protein